MKRILLLYLLLYSAHLLGQISDTAEYKKRIAASNYNKKNYFVEAFPSFGFVLSSKSSLSGNAYQIGHNFKYGYFLRKKHLFLIGSEQYYQHYKSTKQENIGSAYSLSSSFDFYWRYYLLNKRFTPFVQFGFANIFKYDDWQNFDNLTPKLYYIGNIKASAGFSIPVSKYSINVGMSFSEPLFYTKDADLYNQFAREVSWNPFLGISYIFNQDKRKLKEKYI
jgi:hypothetical protein